MISLLLNIRNSTLFFFFFFNDTATTEIYTLSLHDALPIFAESSPNVLKLKRRPAPGGRTPGNLSNVGWQIPDRKSTRLNSSHSQISYAVFCLKKKNTILSLFAYLLDFASHHQYNNTLHFIS